jgi:hypothetical protein
MDDEFTKLYALLTSLSLKNKIIQAETKEEKKETVEAPAALEAIEALEEPVATEALEALEAPEDKVSQVKKTSRRNECIPCISCKRPFYTDGFLARHLRHNPKCKKYTDKYNLREQQKRLKEDQKLADEQKQIEEQKTKQDKMPLHKYVNECLEKSITGELLQCKFCGERFISSYMHYMHYETASSCNIKAFAEFKKYM